MEYFSTIFVDVCFGYSKSYYNGYSQHLMSPRTDKIKRKYFTNSRYISIEMLTLCTHEKLRNLKLVINFMKLYSPFIFNHESPFTAMTQVFEINKLEHRVQTQLILVKVNTVSLRHSSIIGAAT